MVVTISTPAHVSVCWQQCSTLHIANSMCQYWPMYILIQPLIQFITMITWQLAIHFVKHCCPHQLLNSSSCQCVMAAAFCILQEVWCAFKQLLLPTTFIADCSVARRTCCRTAIQINERHPLPMPLSLCYSVFWPSYHLVTQLQQSRS